MNWYYFSEGREVGPLSVTALGEIRASGGIADETPVRREDSAEWEAYSSAFPSKLETQQDLNPSADKPAFKFECPHCQQHISTDEDYSGKTVQCPTCGGEFVVPQAPEKIETIKPGSEISYESQEPEIPTSQEPALTSPPQTPGTSNTFSERVKGGSITPNKGRGKSKFKVMAVAAVIVIVVTVGAVLIPKTKSDDGIAKKDAPKTNQPDSANEQDVTVPEKQDNDNASGPSLDLAKYARESEERDADKGYDYYDSKATYERLKRQQMVANGLKKKGMLNDDTEMFTVIILAIVNTDWSKCSPRLRERADKVKTTFELVGKKRATYDDLADSVKSLNEITDEVSKSASKNPMFVKNLPNIISDLEKDIYGDKTLEMQNKAEQERKGRTLNETKLRENMLKAYPEISFDESNRMVDEIFGKTSSTTEENQRNRILGDIVLFSEKTGTSLSEALEHYKHWRETFSSEMLKIPSSKFDYECGKMVADSLTGAMTAAAGNAKASAQLGLDPKGNRSTWQLMNTNCSYHLAFTQGYQGYIALRSALGKGDMSDRNQNEGNEILSRFENAKDRSERVEADIEAKRFNDSLTHASDSEQSTSDHGSNKHDSVAESTRTNRDSSEPPLAPLAVLRNSTIEEAKECVKLLDEELEKNPGNQRASAVKAAIMDVFKAEASLIAAVSGTKDADEQYRIKMQNLQLASRPSPLTGKVNTTEVERIRREAEAIKTGSESRVRNAKSALKKTIEEARRSAPAPDREALSRVWDQIERRNNL
jgi:hypothetical protein